MNETRFNYLQEWWREAPPDTRQRTYWMLALVLLGWLGGAALAFWRIAELADMAIGLRVLTALGLGPWGYLWFFLEQRHMIVDTGSQPNDLWSLLIFLQFGLGWLIFAAGNAEPTREQRIGRAQQRQRRAQGQLDEAEAAALAGMTNGVPLAKVQDRKQKSVTVGMDFATGQGHTLVIAPTRGGKGLHLTETLVRWPGAAVIVDPKGEQYQRMAGFRGQYIGPIYRIPGHQVHLARYYNMHDDDDIRELHSQLLQPGEDHQPIFAEKSLSLFNAVGEFARARRLNPLRVLLDAARSDIQEVLTGLEQVPAARPYVRQFTNGLPPDMFNQDRFVSSAYGTFSTRLYSYQKHIGTICPKTRVHAVPPLWVKLRGTIFITYSLDELQGVGGVVAAILAGLMRYHKKHHPRYRMLVAVDELAAIRLRNLETYLATAGGFGINLLLYTQAMAQLEGIYGRAGTEAILSNCAHQVWYPPNDVQSARRISALYGTTLKPTRSYSNSKRHTTGTDGYGSQNTGYSESLQEKPILTPTEIMALPKEQVIVLTERDRQVRFIGQRLNPVAGFDKLPPPPLLLPRAHHKREMTVWRNTAAADSIVNQADTRRPSPDQGSAAPPPRKPLK